MISFNEAMEVLTKRLHEKETEEEQDILKYSEEAGFLKSFKEANREEEHEDADHEGTASEGD